MGPDAAKKRLTMERNTTAFHKHAVDSIKCMETCIKEQGVTECAYNKTMWNLKVCFKRKYGAINMINLMIRQKLVSHKRIADICNYCLKCIKYINCNKSCM